MRFAKSNFMGANYALGSHQLDFVDSFDSFLCLENLLDRRLTTFTKRWTKRVF